MEQFQQKTKDIKEYTVSVYWEICRSYRPVGSGILIYHRHKYYLISAYHVFDREEERLKIENDPDEKGIPHDDMDSVFVKVADGGCTHFYHINDNEFDLVESANYDKENQQAVFNDDTEFCVCILNSKMVKILFDAGKRFYHITDVPYPDIKRGKTIIIAGFPGYAQKGEERFRSFMSEMIDDINLSKNGLFRVKFDNHSAFCYEHKEEKQIPGIDGMSGGGLWYDDGKRAILIGIILKQDPNEQYVEGYRLDLILCCINKLKVKKIDVIGVK